MTKRLTGHKRNLDYTNKNSKLDRLSFRTMDDVTSSDLTTDPIESQTFILVQNGAIMFSIEFALRY